MLATWTPDWHEALRRQHRPSALAAGLWDQGGELGSLGARVEVLNEWLRKVGAQGMA